jgi:hypothetical protein
MSIAATRMYRALDVALSSDMYENHIFLSSLRSLHEKRHCSIQVPPHKGGRRISVSGTSGTPAVPIAVEGIRVDVHTTHNPSLTLQAIRHSPGSNMDGQSLEKPHELV